ncbi:hypothetical protein [Mobiluncus mulieris]|uniref:Conjugal transfer protein TrbL n=4 Tax=Mobiluncus mulieris TaxID=2052 RepID=A0A7Y0UW02_9ACTO|nr:hypothetical protein [Mobiluncus mulieris]MCV0003470.1 type IV secretion system protein [Mobiluncus mulieris]NMX04403.1 hypothetical protein [Mobiluncus mulieris]STO15563.1 Uncharacterised protein [Mobiluncus mulieris]
MANVILPTVIEFLSLVPFDPDSPAPPGGIPNVLEFLKNPLLAMFNFIMGIIPTLVTMIIKFIAKAILMGMTSMFIKVMASLTVFTSADLTNPGILEWYSRMFGLGALLCIAFLALQLVSTSIKMQQITGVVEACKAFITAIVGTALLVPFANTAALAVDSLSVKTLGIALKDNSKAVSNLLEVFDTNGPASWFIKFTGSAGSSLIVITGLIMTILLGLFMLFAMTVLIAVIVLRDMLLILVLITGPVAIAGMVWSPTSAWPRKWGTVFVALLFTKFGIALVFAVGLSMMANAHWVGDIRGMFIFMMAIVMIVVALVVPFMAFRFFDFLGETAIGGLDQHLVNSGRAAVGRAVGRTNTAIHSAGKTLIKPAAPGASASTQGGSPPVVKQTTSSSGVSNTSVTGGNAKTPGGVSSSSGVSGNTPPRAGVLPVDSAVSTSSTVSFSGGGNRGGGVPPQVPVPVSLSNSGSAVVSSVSAAPSPPPPVAAPTSKPQGVSGVAGHTVVSVNQVSPSSGASPAASSPPPPVAAAGSVVASSSQLPVSSSRISAVSSVGKGVE